MMADLWSTIAPRGVGAGHVDDRGYGSGAAAELTAVYRRRAVRFVAGSARDRKDERKQQQLWAVYDSDSIDAHPVDYRLAPRDDLPSAVSISAEHGLYFALDVAGMRIAGDAVRSDPDGARRQLGLEGDDATE